MSNGRAMKRHMDRRRGLTHFAPPRPDEEVWTVTQMGAAADREAIEEVRRQTHDGLIRGLGSRRRSGVSWMEFTAAEAPAFLAEFGMSVGERVAFADPGMTPEKADAGLVQFLSDNPDGYLVVAMCEAVQ